VARLAYLAEQADAQLAGLDQLILAGARSPVSFFAYPGRNGDLVPDGCSVIQLADKAQDVETALEQLRALVGAWPVEPGQGVAGVGPAEPGPLTVGSLAAAVAATLPEHAIVVDEANTSGIALPAALAGAARHSLLTLTGGAIGQGLPLAAGAALACPDRPVIALESDGSAMYTISALWTHAREGLDVTTVIFSNRSYAILAMELDRVGATGPTGDAGPAGEAVPVGKAARSLLDLSRPALDFTALAAGLGVPASRASTAGELAAGLRQALAEPGPHLIEAVLP
jgi:acetolactate synthase-1/2/3 large subunit